MPDGRELPQRLARDPLRGRVRRYQLRMLGLQLLELREQLVILLIRDLGLVLDVVEVIVLAYLLAEPIHSLADFSSHDFHLP